MVSLSLLEFIEITKALKMLYGTQVSVIFFEKNLESVTGLKISDLNKLIKNSKLQAQD